MNRRIFFCIGWAVAAAFCQEPAGSLEPMLEADQIVDETSLLEHFEQLVRRPIDLNRASAQELAELPVPSAVNEKILNYRKTHGPFRSLEDLNKIKGLSAYLPQIQPFIVVEPCAGKIRVSGRHRLRNRPEAGGGLSVAGQMYHRLRFERERTACGLLIEKDAGEAAFNDFVTGYITGEPHPGMKVMVGDYTLEAGRGLVFGRPFALPLGTDPLTPARLQRFGVFPFLSANENFAFRGAALGIRRTALQLCLSASDKRRDAALEEGKVVYLPEDGLHRTPTELQRRKALRERSLGLALFLNPLDNLQLGVTALQNRFSAPFALEKESRLRFAGNKNRLGSIFSELSLKDLALFGEAAWCASGGSAFTFGALGYDADYDWLLIWRRYATDFISFYASAFGEPSANNQEGFYLGGNYRLSRFLQATFYYDLSKKPSFFQPSGRFGDVLMIGLQGQISPRITLRSRLKLRRREESVRTLDRFGNPVSAEAEEQRGSCRMEMEFRPHRLIRLRNAVEWTFASPERSSHDQGALLCWRMQINGRTLRAALGSVFFDAPTYAVRFYQPEADVEGALPLVMLYGRGVRSYGVLAVKAFTFMLSAKYEQTVYRFQPAGGETPARKVSLQLDWQL